MPENKKAASRVGLIFREEEFDAGYQYFTISAMDNAGNMSEVYKTANPYYTDPEAEDSNESNPAKQLSVSAEATKPSSATGQVTEHTKTDSEGNTTSETSLAEQKKAAMQEADASEQAENNAEQSENGKEFYTIQTASDKVFYLIIDRDGDEEMVYFLTEISENDLLNTTTDNSETLPKNSAALESAIPVSDSALPNNNAETDSEETEELPEDGEESTEESTEEPEEQPAQPDNPMGTYIVLGIIAVIGIGAGYYFKVVKKKKEQFIDEDDEEDEEEVLEDEDETEDTEDDFFEKDDEEDE
ncbi:MAG: CD1107 family mobile element protein [Ruminococcus sp.]